LRWRDQIDSRYSLHRTPERANIEIRLAVFGLMLPPQLVAPLGTPLPDQFIKLAGRRALIEGFALIAAVADWPDSQNGWFRGTRITGVGRLPSASCHNGTAATSLRQSADWRRPTQLTTESACPQAGAVQT
jgi:hypothetical protein